MVSVQLGEAFVAIRANLSELDRGIARAGSRIRTELAGDTAESFVVMNRQIRRSMEDVGDQIGKTAVEGSNAMDKLRETALGALRDIGKSILGAGIGSLGEALLPKGGGFFSGLLGGVFSGVLDGIFGRGVGSGLDLPRLAGGGRLLAGQTAIVGERGPEFFTAGASGIVTPLDGGGSNGVAVQQTFNITTGVAQTVRAELIGLLPRIADSVKASLADEVQRGGAFASAFRG